MIIGQAAYSARDLEIVLSAEDMTGTKGELRLGDIVILNSGSPLLVVVDITGDSITASDEGGVELTLPRICFSFLGRRGLAQEVPA